jgi:hypothetical protein
MELDQPLVEQAHPGYVDLVQRPRRADHLGSAATDHPDTEGPAALGAGRGARNALSDQARQRERCATDQHPPQQLVAAKAFLLDLKAVVYGWFQHLGSLHPLARTRTRPPRWCRGPPL